MKLSVVVAMYHDYFFDDIVASYAWQTIKNDYEVIFMLTGKNPSPLETTLKRVAGERRLPWIVQTVPGMSNCHSRNVGTKLATGNAVLFIDGDQIIAPNLFQEHWDAHSQSDKKTEAAVGMGICNINVVRYQNSMEVWLPHMINQRASLSGDVSVMPKQKIYSPDCLSFVKNLTLSQAIGLAWWHNMNDFIDYVNVVGRNVSVSRNKFIEIGMWDEELAYTETTKSRGWEDTEFGLRAFKADFQFMIVPSWTVHLEHPRMNKDGGLENVVKMARKHRWFLDARPDWWEPRYDRNQIRKML